MLGPWVKSELGFHAMRIYRIKPGPEGDVDVFGNLECFLTGVDCPVCTQWGSGFHYPTIECGEVATLGEGVTKFLVEGKIDFRRKIPGPMTVAEFASVKALLEPFLGPNRPVAPGLTFGPTTGEMRGTVQDFTWGVMSTAYVKESVFEEIRAGGFPLFGARADLTFKTLKGRRWFKHEGPGEALIELEVPPMAQLIPGSYERCDICGRTQVGRRRRVLDRATFDPSIPMQCVYEMRTHVLVTETFCEFIRTKNYSGVKLSVQEAE